jgi:hypothetical protein
MAATSIRARKYSSDYQIMVPSSTKDHETSI